MYAFLFDIDGTLISSGGAGRVALEEALAAAFRVRQSIDRLQLSGRTDRAIVRDLFQLHGIEESLGNLQRMLAAYLQLLPECLARSKGKVLPGIASVLDQLGATSDVAVGLLTGNIRDGARIKLGHYGLAHHFPFGGFGDHHFCRNEVAKEALAAVHERFDGSIRSENICVIGDTPLDIACARVIGARAVALGTGWHSLDELAAHQPDLLLADLSDPGPLFSLWR